MHKQRRAYDVQLESSLFDPDTTERVAHYREAEDFQYRTWLYLVGLDLPYVRSVQYALHEAIAEPIRFVDRSPSNPSCKTSFWTPGEFPVRALITMKDGDQLERDFFIRFGNQLNEAAGYQEE